MSGGFLSRVTLRHDAPVQALARLLVPDGEGPRHGAAHHLLWTLFGDTPERRRDFLWRQVEAGHFMVLSARQPVDAHALFDIETRPFEPVLKEGDRLRFLLRANATVDRKTPGRARSQRHDVVMDMLHRLPRHERADARESVVASALESWAGRQGARAGFALAAPVTVEGCDVWRIPRSGGRGMASFGVVDLTGELRVTVPETFLAAILHGFGRARAFGCGLMLVRRAI
ncbi:type I-E CRISPR-associated protein Cas6/Cse3/CasE [Gluconacetobacter azotocaptans]|uniref:Type I-E CRISPR-associated protein Cas6/Cse3/CasE n=1 Tax=Gluconacetobacter azotocaptans TaxID=142834 RepID=A0A7W4JPR5_9PROT|nr:type I-E CRISPR-associated protein Cas6/Cse3/CasE [Gluconacetobacter azotocaptans]MBB2188680.1 type I-E CRISPR-associated protein Cas6/Cse3/CasE [Gluconacetobacter azotocaptans]GBQ35105.1 CRISPR-associated protein Cse3 [Gluconacetobacter azotocaptans DSM 13594]